VKCVRLLLGGLRRKQSGGNGEEREGGREKERKGGREGRREVTLSSPALSVAALRAHPLWRFPPNIPRCEPKSVLSWGDGYVMWNAINITVDEYLYALLVEIRDVEWLNTYIYICSMR
jgi:hypothetical protein